MKNKFPIVLQRFPHVFTVHTCWCCSVKLWLYSRRAFYYWLFKVSVILELVAARFNQSEQNFGALSQSEAEPKPVEARLARVFPRLAPIAWFSFCILLAFAVSGLKWFCANPGRKQLPRLQFSEPIRKKQSFNLFLAVSGSIVYTHFE